MWWDKRMVSYGWLVDWLADLLLHQWMDWLGLLTSLILTFLFHGVNRYKLDEFYEKENAAGDDDDDDDDNDDEDDDDSDDGDDDDDE